MSLQVFSSRRNANIATFIGWLFKGQMMASFATCGPRSGHDSKGIKSQPKTKHGSNTDEKISPSL
jgi:hypothetical protein